MYWCGPADGSKSDQATEWAAPGDETGLEEPMWQLGLGGGEEAYPERPGEPDCIFYLRNGFCGYGSRCRFNHPCDPGGVGLGAGRPGGGDYPERAVQPICQDFVRTGTCKFGYACKYHHPRQAAGSPSLVTLNVYGYPLRLGEKECSYYMKTGKCKFGVTCKFHHPQPACMPLPAAGPVAIPVTYSPDQSSPPPMQYGVMAGNWLVAKPPMIPGSYVQGPYGSMLLSPGVVPLPGWTPYPAQISPAASPATQSTIGASQLYGITPFFPPSSAYMGPYPSISSSAGSSNDTRKEHSFPERPGQPECQYYLKTGDCKFGSSCRYHHPPEWVAPSTGCALSHMGLPLRPGAPTCAYYAQNGICKFGPTCKFDHPMGSLSYSPSASSLTDMPVAPYPVGSSIGTLAPSISSSDFRAEVITGSNKGSLTRMSSSTSTSSSSVGSILSGSGSVLEPSIQPSSQSLTSPASCSSTARETDVHSLS
ncbi:hypothetical protein Nepgr_030269 [Nepenthes gracilis]|uniref:C3H1-type domain-containing protein n=1 Tax=Nepenthes gracilis TaxID=150966 RepID=A0AAD3Y6E1_NEPGR|nr:hypothetical protein Nepgr_030269 [Nepenthes gracilis]